MLSQSNIDKLNMHALYRHEPVKEWRGKIHENDLYHCFNWVFRPVKGNNEYYMVDTYYGDKSIKLSDENFDGFEFLFDTREFQDCGTTLAIADDYADNDIRKAAVDSGGYSRPHVFVRKGAKRSYSKLLAKTERMKEQLLRELSFLESDIKRMQKQREICPDMYSD